MMSTLMGLLLASSVCLVGLILSAAMLVHDQKRNRQQCLRIDMVAGIYRASGARGSARAYRLDFQLKSASWINWAQRMLRYDASHRVIYPVGPWVVLIISIVLSVALARVIVEFVGPAGWVSAPAICFFVGRSFYGWCEDRLLNTLFKQFPDALAMIVRAVRVGLPIVEALRVVSRENAEPTAREFAALVSQTSIGVPLDDALREMAERNRLPEYRFFATALSLQSQTGGGLAETLENLAETIRKRVAAKMRGHALAAEARMSAYILGSLPVVTGALLLATNPGYIGVLFTDQTGRTLLVVACGLLSVGGFTMRTLIRKSLT